jgi:hypothetical protein
VLIQRCAQVLRMVLLTVTTMYDVRAVMEMRDFCGGEFSDAGACVALLSPIKNKAH